MPVRPIAFEGFGGVAIAGDAFGSPDDPPIVLVPGAGQSRALWRGSARALADAGRYAICVDLRGHGDSGHAGDGRYDLDAYVADLRAILATLRSRACVVASGMGAIVALVAVGEGAPDLVSGLALVDATIWFDGALAERWQTALRGRTQGFDDRAAVLDAIGGVHPGEPRPADDDRLLAAYAEGEDGRLRWRGDPRTLTAPSLLAQEQRLDRAAAALRVPVTLIRGSLNEAIPADAMQRLQATIAGAEYREITGAGHYAATDREDAFNAVLLDFLERRLPRQPVSYIGGSEARVLRDALGCFGTGVTVVTTIRADGAPIGMTANSFTSVSLDPPLILVSIARTSFYLPVFEAAGRFAVNVLHIGQQPIAGRFASRVEDRFAGIEWETRADGGSPILPGSLASFDCRTYAVNDGGDHLMFVGRVEQAWFEPHRDPLLYFRGKYRRLHFA